MILLRVTGNRVLHVHPDHFRARRHNRADVTIRETEHPFNHTVRGLFKDARFYTLLDHARDLVFGDGRFFGRPRAEQPQNCLGRNA